MLIRARRARSWRGNIVALAAVACAFAGWSAGPAHANGPVAGVPASVTAVQQAAAPVVTTVASPVRSAASPGRPAARVLRRARAAAVDSTTAAETASTRAATAVEPASSGAATIVETGSNHAAKAVETASTAEVSQRTAAAVRGVSKHTADAVRSAPQRAATMGAGPKRVVAVVETAASNLNSIASTGQVSVSDRGPSAPASTRSGDVVAPLGAALPATAAGRDSRPAVAPRPTTDAARGPQAQRLERAHGDLTGLTGRTQPGAPASAATGLAGAAAATMLGLLGFVIFASQRLGNVVWLRPASAPASPFLALPERPG